MYICILTNVKAITMLFVTLCAKYYGQCTLHLVSVEKILDVRFVFLFLIPYLLQILYFPFLLNLQRVIQKFEKKM